VKLALLLSLLLSISLPAFAAFPEHVDIRDELDNTPVGARVQLGTQLQEKKRHMIRAQYNFAVQGGAIGVVELLDVDGKKAQIPGGAIITGCLLDVITAPNTATTNDTTLSFSSGIVGGDLQVAAGFTPSYTPSGIKACIPVGTAATMIKLGTTTKNYTPSMTIGVLALTAGKINLWIEYILSR